VRSRQHKAPCYVVFSTPQLPRRCQTQISSPSEYNPSEAETSIWLYFKPPVWKFHLLKQTLFGYIRLIRNSSRVQRYSVLSDTIYNTICSDLHVHKASLQLYCIIHPTYLVKLNARNILRPRVFSILKNVQIKIFERLWHCVLRPDTSSCVPNLVCNMFKACQVCCMPSKIHSFFIQNIFNFPYNQNLEG
jgi:hypothetical protein